MTEADVLVIGGGIAGLSLAAELGSRGRVVLVEREAALAQHTTGRSAAMFLESYGSPEIRQLTRASREHLLHVGDPGAGEGTVRTAVGAGSAAGPGPGVGGALSSRPLLWIARADQQAELDRAVARIAGLQRLDRTEAVERCPALDPSYVAGAALEPAACDIDVAMLVQSFARTARAGGATILTGAEVRSARRQGTGWVVDTGAGPVAATTVVLAAGAWADHLAGVFGAEPVGLRPLRRTIAIARPLSLPIDPSWPLVASVDEAFYFRPEGPNLLVSPADETLSPPCDARPDEADVARALDLVNGATVLGLRSVLTTWAGLRTFAADRNPVVGHDPGVAGLFWLAGQGGYGIQTAPALARLAAALLCGDALPDDLAAAGVDPVRLTPARFSHAGSGIRRRRPR